MLPQLHAEQQIAAIEAANAPHMTKEHHRNVMRRLQRMLGHAAEKAETADAEKLAALGITVVTVQGGDPDV